MPYPAHSTQEAQHAAATYLTAKARYDANKNILKAGAIKKEMETSGKALSEQLENDMIAVRHNAVEHFQKIDAWLAQAASTLSRAKEAAARWLQTHDDHDAHPAVVAADACEAIATAAAEDARQFGDSWFPVRQYNNRDVDPKYLAKFYALRNALMEEGKGFTAKVLKISAVHHEAIALRNLQLSRKHSEDRVLLEKQGAAGDILRSLQHLYATGFMGLKTVQNAAGNCETIHDWAHNPRLKKDGNLKQIESIFVNLSNLRKGYVQTLESMKKIFQTSHEQFDQDELNDQAIHRDLNQARVLVDDTRQKLQFVENGYKNAMSDMTAIRKALKK
jgi:hypothetical protein